MAGKGSPQCCCVGCDRPPVNLTGSRADDLFDASPVLAQNLCLSCMPQQLCLSTTCNGVAEPSLFTRQDPCRYGQFYSYWAGYLNIYRQYVQAEIQFDIVGSDCYLCFVCPALGITGYESAARVLLTWAIQQSWSPHCQSCNDEFYPDAPVQWNLTLAGYPCVINAGMVSNTSLTPAMPCDNCASDPCEPEQVFYIEEDLQAPRFSSCAICLGCACIGTYMCIVVRKFGVVVESVNVKICNFGWVTPLGTSVYIDRDPSDKTCRLRLATVGGITYNGASVLPLYGSIAGQCPDVAVSWAFDNPATPVNEPINVSVSSSECGSCASLTAVPCCPDPLPRVLYATLDGGPCSCESLSIPIVETTLAGDVIWMGNSAPDAFCSAWGTKCQVLIQLFCSNNTWQLNLRYSTDGAPGYTSYTYYTGSCTPMSLVFTGIYAHGKGDCECSPPFFPKCNDLTVSITE